MTTITDSQNARHALQRRIRPLMASLREFGSQLQHIQLRVGNLLAAGQLYRLAECRSPRDPRMARQLYASAEASRRAADAPRRVVSRSPR